MIKRVAVFFLAVALTASYAQAQFTFGARVGANFTKIGGEDFETFFDYLLDDIFYGFGLGDLSFKPKMKPGFQIGIVASKPMSNEKFTFQPGLIIAQQGMKWNASESESLMGTKVKYDIDVKMILNYFQIPVNFLYNHDLNSDLKLLLQAGPYLGYGISGKIKMKISASISGAGYNESESESETVTLEFGEDVNSFDLGLGFGAGLMFKDKFHASLGYNLGLADIADDMTGKNKGIALTLTYMFGK